MSYADHPHKNGRPTRAASASRTKSIRFTPEELDALQLHAAQLSEKHKRDVSVSEVLRAGAAQLGLFSRRRVALEL